MKSDFVITIARQFGCGGRTIGNLLAEKLGIAYYDNDLIKLAAEKNGVSVDFYREFDEKATSKFASIFGYSTPIGGFLAPTFNDMVVNDKLFYTQSNIIKELAVRPCIIVGRCADYVLADRPNLVKMFLHADLDTRRDRIVNKYGIEDKNITKLIAKADKQRAQYYNSYTDQVWGDITNYDISLNTSRMGIQETVDVLYEYLQRLPFGD